MEELQNLVRQLEIIETEYQTMRDEYLDLPRAKRKVLKPQIDEIKNKKHLLEITLEEKKMQIMIDSSNNNEQLIKCKQKLKKLKSKIDHEFWLAWTRSVWGFKETESEAKTGLHPAQFSAKLPEILIKFFSFVDDTVLDVFMGTGTTLEIAKKLKRHSIGVDINIDFLNITKQRLRGEFRELLYGVNLIDDQTYTPLLLQGDARNLVQIPNESVQLVVTHPPYWNAVKISELENDLSNVNDEDYNVFIDNMDLVFSEINRVLEKDRVAAIVVGDVMRKVNGTTQLYPLHADFINIARKQGFIVWDIYIWETKIRTSGGKPLMGSYPYPHKVFSQFAHNYVLIFRKVNNVNG